jgi:hypothetical protein
LVRTDDEPDAGRGSATEHADFGALLCRRRSRERRGKQKPEQLTIILTDEDSPLLKNEMQGRYGALLAYHHDRPAVGVDAATL